MIDDYVQAARAQGVEVRALPAEAGWFGVSVRDLGDGQQVWVVRTLVNWRVLETHPDALGPGRFWCYPGVGIDTYLVAVRHAALYGDGEPDGWIKAYDGRVGDLPRRADQSPGDRL